MKYAAIGPVAIYLPEKVEDNDFLGAQYPRWDMELIFAKTGIRQRHIAAPGECASDMGVAAAERLFAKHHIDRGSIDFLLFCTQTPDYPLPTTACLIQDRLGLPKSMGALDFNLGCSGYVYGLAMADGLIRSGTARRVLLITAETYSKYIDPTDRSLRTIFGDGAAATLVEASDVPSLGGFVFGTDGSGGNMLLVSEGGARLPADAIQPRKRRRWPSSLYMDGPELVKFSLDIAPPLIEQVLARAEWKRDQIDMYLIHQATRFMLDHLRDRLSLDREHTPEALEDYGNTVSSTLPILIHDLRESARLRPGKQTLLMGFGVGLSWAGCVWTETWPAQQVQVETTKNRDTGEAVEQSASQPGEAAPDSSEAKTAKDEKKGKKSDKTREAA